MAQSVTPFLMFEGRAEEAMTLYVSLFADGAIEQIQRYGPSGPGKEGTVLRAAFRIAGQRVMCIDSPAKHGFAFTPSTSMFVQCDSEAELDSLFTALSTDGAVLMPPNNYGFSTKFTWINDRFGVSWQLNFGELT